MKGMIFAAGLGTRLRPLTDHVPKSLIEVGGVPILSHIISRMADAGIIDILINTHHLANRIEKYVAANGGWGLDIELSYEEELLETGGAIVKNYDKLKGEKSILLYNSDIYSDFPLQEMIESYNAGECDVLLLTDWRKTSRYLLFDENNMMRGWLKNDGEVVRPNDLDYKLYSRKAFGGVHIINNEALRLLKKYSDKKGAKFSITDFYIDNCNHLKIGSFTPSAAYNWWDIGKPEVLEAVKAIKG